MKRTQTVCVDVCLSDFDDDVIVDEVLRRGLAKEVQAAIVEAAGNSMSDSMRAPVAQAVGYLMARRPADALTAVRTAIAMVLHEEMMLAYEAMLEGRHADALSELDRLLEPSAASVGRQGEKSASARK